MQFTLDSVENFKACLEEVHKGKQVKYRPFITNDLTDLTVQKDNTCYFGIITNGNDLTMHVRYQSSLSIQVESNAQIIEGFTHLQFDDSEEV